MVIKQNKEFLQPLPPAEIKMTSSRASFTSALLQSSSSTGELCFAAPSCRGGHKDSAAPVLLWHSPRSSTSLVKLAWLQLGHMALWEVTQMA